MSDTPKQREHISWDFEPVLVMLGRAAGRYTRAAASTLQWAKANPGKKAAIVTPSGTFEITYTRRD